MNNNNDLYNILNKLNSIAPDNQQAAPAEQKTSVLKENMESVLAKKYLEEKSKVNPYAVGMAQAMKSTGDKPPLKKSTITKAHSIAKKVNKVDEDWDDMIKSVEKKGKEEKGTGKFDKKKISTGTVYTRKYDKKSGETDDSENVTAVKRGRGRPKKSAFESNSIIDRMVAESYDELEEGEGTIDAILRKHAKAVKDFKNGADLDYDLESDLYDYYFNQGDIRNYDADASEYVAGRLADELGLAESYDELEEGENTYMPSGDDIAGKDPRKQSLADRIKGLGKDLMNKIAPDDETLLKDLEKKTIGEEEGEELNYEQDQLRQAIGDEMFAQVKSAVEQGISLASTEMPDAMYDALYDYYTENGEMPYGTAKARDGDPAEWIENKLDELFDAMAEGFNPDGSYNTSDEEAMEFDDFEADEDSLAEMMKLAGMQVKEAAKPDFLDIDKDGDTEEDMKDAAKDAEEKETNESIEQVDECGMGPMEMPMGELTISGSPEALAAMLKLAGMQAPAMMQQPMEEELEPSYEASTTPDEEVMPVQVLTKGGNGEVAGQEKPMHKDGAARFSDNPLAMKESSISDLDKMGRDIMKSYESIKVKK